MDISYLGHSAFRIKGKNAIVVTDPFDPAMLGIKFPKIEADIVTVSHEHDDHNRVDLVEGNPYLIRGVGEYEIKGVTVIGIPTFHDSAGGKDKGKNVVYSISMDDLSLVHLGDLGHKLSKEEEEIVGSPDILFIPVGGAFTLDAKTAVEIVSSLEPKIVIPMHYLTSKMNQTVFAKLAGVEAFLKEIGKTDVVPLQKLSITKDKLGEELQVVVME